MDLHQSSHPARVLVVDDEPLLRTFNVDVLTDAGFEVIAAADADEALRALERFNDIRFVFTDVEMPGQLDGFALADRIEAQYPDVGVLVTSGRRYPSQPAARSFVPKPYNVSHVVELIDAFVHAHH